MRKIDAHYMEVYEFMLECNFKMPSLRAKIKTAIKILCKKTKKLGLTKVLKFVSTRLLKK